MAADAEELIDTQRGLARADPPLWRPADVDAVRVPRRGCVSCVALRVATNASTKTSSRPLSPWIITQNVGKGNEANDSPVRSRRRQPRWSALGFVGPNGRSTLGAAAQRRPRIVNQRIESFDDPTEPSLLPPLDLLVIGLSARVTTTAVNSAMRRRLGPLRRRPDWVRCRCLPGSTSRAWRLCRRR
jgi:hypothetical protein